MHKSDPNLHTLVFQQFFGKWSSRYNLWTNLPKSALMPSGLKHFLGQSSSCYSRPPFSDPIFQKWPDHAVRSTFLNQIVLSLRYGALFSPAFPDRNPQLRKHSRLPWRPLWSHHISKNTVIRPVPSFHLQTQAPGLFLWSNVPLPSYFCYRSPWWCEKWPWTLAVTRKLAK
jgi:hypothetical protein